MFKILILSRYYNLSDAIPDRKTTWHFNEPLSDQGLVQELFDLYANQLKNLGLVYQ